MAKQHTAQLSVKGLATGFAVFWGVYMGALTLLVSMGIRTMWVSQEAFSVIAAFYPGLTPTTGGALLALVYGLTCGAICGGLIAWLYNWGSSLWK